MRIKAPSTEPLGIEIPIIQVPIGGAATPELAAGDIVSEIATEALSVLDRTRAMFG